MILSGTSLKRWHSDIITPFIDHKEIAHGMSYGLSLAGYDIRIKENIELYSGGFSLASSVERFKLPKNVLGLVKDKSSLARQGLSVFNTVIEPGWEGYLTLELAYHGFQAEAVKSYSVSWRKEIPLIIKAGSPIAQVIFMYTDNETEGYNGKYQGQESRPVEFISEGC